jgi:ribosomal protein L11 methyltransferase
MLSKFSVKRPYTVVVAVVVVLILGVISFINLNTDLLPSIDLPYVVIMTTYPGASPEEVEMIVTKPIEQAVATVNNIKNVSSISRENSSIVIMEFNNDTNMDSATIEINGMLDLIKPAWDNYSISSPMLMRLNPDMLPVMISAVDVEGLDIVEISEMVNQKIIPEFESVNGVASVKGVGLLDEKIEVLIDNEKIEDLNKKILNAVDSELSEAEDQLMKAKKEIDDGKSKLASEEEKQTGKLSEGLNAIASAKEQITQAESQISAGKSELVKTREELNNALNEIKQKEEELKEAEAALSALGDKLRKEDKVKLESIKQNLEVLSQKKAETTISKYIEIGKVKIEYSELYEDDWANNWKAYYKPFNITRDIIIKPSWEDYSINNDGILIEMDPGMAFGTGTHETTRMCALLLEKFIQSGDNLIDVGSGSGILSIISAKLGAEKIIALDVDEDAVNATKNNCKVNNVCHKVKVFKGTLDSFSKLEKYFNYEKSDVVVANIIADVIINLCEAVRLCTKRKGLFIASGIIKDKKDSVLSKYLENGFDCEQIVEEGEWVAIVFICPGSL